VDITGPPDDPYDYPAPRAPERAAGHPRREPAGRRRGRSDGDG
jgi:hypothetical protein